MSPNTPEVSMERIGRSDVIIFPKCSLLCVNIETKSSMSGS